MRKESKALFYGLFIYPFTIFYPGWVAKRPLRKLILQKGVTTFMQNWEETKSVKYQIVLGIINIV